MEMEKLGVVAKCKDVSTCDRVNSIAFSRKSSGELRDIFQKYMDDVLRMVSRGVIGIADDVVAYDITVKEHNQALHKLMITAKEY
ncbi:hypothetical protein SK128_000446, partial [Halocaridina rubra]